MSRLGKLPIELPTGTEAKLGGDSIIVKGKNGELKIKLHDLVKVEIIDRKVSLSVKNPNDRKEKSLWGLYRNLIRNMVLGVNEGFEKKLEINGVGYRASSAGNKLVLNLGFSHPVEYKIPENITISVEGNIITVNGPDKQLVGEVAAQIKKIRPPEPYKGKGIKYLEEILRRKAGKTATKGD